MQIRIEGKCVIFNPVKCPPQNHCSSLYNPDSLGELVAVWVWVISNCQLGMELPRPSCSPLPPPCSDLGVFIGAIDGNGFAAKSNKLQVCDRILACNGVDFTKESNKRWVSDTHTWSVLVSDCCHGNRSPSN